MAAVKLFPQSQAIPERSSRQYSVALRTPTDTPVDPIQVTDVFATLRDIRSDEIINGRDAQQVLNVDGGVLAEGLFTLQLDPDDMPAIGTQKLQPRRLTLDLRLNGGGRATREIHFWVHAFPDIAA